MKPTKHLAFFGLALAAALPLAAANEIKVRVTPPNKAQFLQSQRFDIRVEATGPSGSTVSGLTVTLDGVDITSRGEVTTPAANVRNWMFRWTELGVPGARVIAAAASGANGISGSGQSTITVRAWDRTQIRPELPLRETFGDIAPTAAPAPGRLSRFATAEDAIAVQNDLHVGAVDPTAMTAWEPNAATGRKARNVILFIGDGMGITHRTAARILSKGYTQGKANGTLAMDQLGWQGALMTSSLDSLITDSAPGAHNYATGNKTNNGMEGVFPDNTPDNRDNPRIDNLANMGARFLGKVTGIVSDAFLTDATPAAMAVHTANRGDGTDIANQYFDLRKENGLKVLLGGGAYHFIPKSRTGSRRTDERDVVQNFKDDGWGYVETATALNAYAPSGSNPRLLGLFSIDNMNVAFDKLKMGDPSVVSAFPDQPFLREMTKKAIDVLETYPNGFFLMVEGAHIDKQAHGTDAERSIYDVIQLDQAVQVALDYARRTNTDADPDNDTLVIVGADHECGGLVLPGVGRPGKEGTRDYVKAYNYSDSPNAGVANDPATLNFPEYVDANGDGYPDNPDAAKKLIMHMGASPDRFEDWKSNAKPKAAATITNGVASANAADPDKNVPGALQLVGVVENGANGGEAQSAAVHTPADIPVSAYGPGASQFAKVSDNTEAFFYIWNAFLGTYPTPTQW